MPLCSQSVSSDPGLLNVLPSQRVSVIELEVSLRVLSVFFSHVTCLIYVDGPAFAWYLVDLQNFWSQRVLDWPENAACPRQ
jgi:hypothetical protein